MPCPALPRSAHQHQITPVARFTILFTVLFLALGAGSAYGQDAPAAPSVWLWEVEAQGGDFAAVSLVQPGFGWAMTGSSPRQFYRLTGEGWERTSLTLFEDAAVGAVNDFVMTGPNRGWAVGISPERYDEPPAKGYNYGRVWRLEGGAWTPQSLKPAGELTTLRPAGSDSGYAYGWRSLYYYAGDAWTLLRAYTQIGDIFWIGAADGLADGSRFWYVRRFVYNDSADLIDSQSDTPFRLPAPLIDLDVLSAEYGWGISANGVVMRFDGATWGAVDAPIAAGDTLTHVQTVGIDNVFIIGYTAANQDFILHYDGVAWTRSASPIAGQFSDLALISAADGWILTQNGGALHWDGATWQDRSAAVTPLGSGPYVGEVAMISPDLAVAAGGNAILTDAGGRWQPVSLADRQVVVNAVDVLSPTFGVAAGSIIDAQRVGEQRYAAWQFEGGGWAVQSNELPTCGRNSILDVSLVDHEFGVAAGYRGCQGGYGEMMQFNFGRWGWSGTQTDFGLWPRKVAMAEMGNGWGVAYIAAENRDVMLRYEGMDWYIYSLEIGPCQLFHDFAVRSKKDVWAVASYGGGCPAAAPGRRYAVIMHFNGREWTWQPAPDSAMLRGIDLVGRDEMWAVGEAGAIYRYTEKTKTWLRQPSPAGFDLYGIDMWDSTHGRIWGERGAILSLADRPLVVSSYLYLPAVAR